MRTESLKKKVRQHKKKVCINGIGPAGMSALIALSKHPDDIDVMAYSPKHDIYGPYKYDWRMHLKPEVKLHDFMTENGIIPRQYIEMPDFPLDKSMVQKSDLVFLNDMDCY